jgi:hypothetical protein
MGAKVWVSQRRKSLRRIRVRNCGFSKSDFFVVYEDIWIAICPFFVVVNYIVVTCGNYFRTIINVALKQQLCSI